MFDFLFGKDKNYYNSEYNKAINNTKQSMADSVYQHHYDKALYDANKDYFDKMGVKDPSASYWNENGQRTNALNETVNQYSKYLNDLNKEKEDVAWKNRYNIFGDGLITGQLNRFHQTGTALQDFATSGTKEWEKGNRDWLSDLGSAGEIALDALTLGSGSGATAGAKALGKTVAKGAGLGAAYGLTGGLNEMGAKNFDLGQLALNTGIGAGLGGATGAVGYGLGKVGDKIANYAKKNRTTATTENVVSNLYDDMGNPIAKNGVSYQDALKTAGLDDATDKHLLGRIMSGAEVAPEDLTPEVMDRLANKLNIFTETLGGKKAPKTAVVGNEIFSPKQQLQRALDMVKTIPNGTTTTPVTTYTVNGLANKKLGQIKQGIGDLVKNLPGIAKDELAKAKNSNLGKNTSKIGTNVANLLKTKKGKVLLGGSAGLTLAGLLKNRNDNAGQLSDEEIQELYNYVYGGGQ